jgi:tetratricopeptide (TPR) repeat protein
MKTIKRVSILAILIVIACLIIPVTAEDAFNDTATLHYNRGISILNTKNYQAAIEVFDLALASNTTRLQLGSGLMYLYQGKGYAQIQLEKYDDALQTFDQGLALYPKDSLLWNNKGYALNKLGRYQDALTAYDKAISFERNYTNALINRGDTLSKMGRFDEACDAYTKAIESDPGNSVATAGLESAQKAAASALQGTLIVMAVVVIIALGAVIWYVKFRKPAEPTKTEKKSKEKKK